MKAALATEDACRMAVGDAMAQGAIASEAFASEGRYITIETQRDEVDFAREETKRGFGLRVSAGDAVGFSSTNDPENLKAAVLAALSGSRARLGADDFAGFPGTGPIPRVDGIWDSRVAELSVADCVDDVQAMLGGADSVEGGRVVSSMFSCYDYRHHLHNSEGLQSAWAGTVVIGLCECAAGEKDAVTAMEFGLSRHRDLDFRRLGETAARLAVESAGGAHGPSGVMDVVFSPMAFAELFEHALHNALDGDAVCRGRSPWAERVGETVAPGWLSLTDDGLMAGGLGTDPCDDEGTPSRRSVLVEDGVLRGFIHSRESARKLGTESTANAVRESYQHLPDAQIRNLRLECPREPPLDGCERGMLVHGLVGAHTINPHSGEFSLQASNAFLVRRGEAERPVTGMMLSGNVFEALKRVAAVSPEERCMGNVVAPWVRLGGLNVVGRG